MDEPGFHVFATVCLCMSVEMNHHDMGFMRFTGIEVFMNENPSPS
jgi:hypothetical protein